jgi:hypothetical protein
MFDVFTMAAKTNVIMIVHAKKVSIEDAGIAAFFSYQAGTR